MAVYISQMKMPDLSCRRRNSKLQGDTGGGKPGLGFLEMSCSIAFLILLGQMGVWQNGLGSAARWDIKINST